MTVLKRISNEHMVSFLNEILATDPMAINALFSLRVSCNKELADHPTVQVGTIGKSNHYMVGLVGILNGMFGADIHLWGHLSADYREGRIVRFRLLTEKEVTNIIAKKKEKSNGPSRI